MLVFNEFQFGLEPTYLERIARKYKGINLENWKSYFDFPN